jgi:hypothetical protein
MFGGIAGQASPAATDIQDLIPGLQIDFPADEAELFPLGFRQIVRPLKVAATVLVAGVQKGKEKIVSQIVVPPGNDTRSGRRLAIEDPGGKVKQKRPEISSDFILQVSLEKTTDELIDPRTIPPAGHVGLSETQTTIFEHAGVKPIIPHPDIPEIGTVDPDARFRQPLPDGLTILVHCAPP